MDSDFNDNIESSDILDKYDILLREVILEIFRDYPYTVNSELKSNSP